MRTYCLRCFVRPVILFLAIGALSISCARSDNPAQRRAEIAGNNRGDIKIAITSPWSQNRNLLREGIELAAKEINSSGGLLGRRIALVPVDDENDVGVGQKAAYKIASDEEIVAVIGHSSSAISVPNSLLYHYYGILMLSPLSTNPRLTTQGFDKVFRNIPTDEIFGKEAANFCADKGWSKVLVYYLDNSYGESLANAFELQCNKVDLNVEDRESYKADYGVSDYEELASFWKRNYEFDAVYMAGIMPQAGEIISVFRQIGIDVPIIGGDAFDHPLLLKTAGKYSNDVYAVTIYDAQSEWKPFKLFKKDFLDAYGKPADQAALQGYDALEVLAAGIKAAGSTVPAKIAAGLRSIDRWEGPAGPYRFDENGDVVGKGVVVKKMDDGHFVKVR